MRPHIPSRHTRDPIEAIIRRLSNLLFYSGVPTHGIHLIATPTYPIASITLKNHTITFDSGCRILESSHHPLADLETLSTLLALNRAGETISLPTLCYCPLVARFLDQIRATP